MRLALGTYAFDVDEAERLYRSGLSARKVATAVGSNRESIRKAMGERGVVRGRLEFRGTLESRLWARINKLAPNGCWLWTGLANNQGYGTVRVDGRSTLAHRAVYALLRGEAPAGLDACHTCDTPLCVNPDHIFFGSRADNMRDASKKGRLAHGESAPWAIYTEVQIRRAHALWMAGASIAEAAKATAIDRRQLWAILRGHAWGHLRLEARAA